MLSPSFNASTLRLKVLITSRELPLATGIGLNEFNAQHTGPVAHLIRVPPIFRPANFRNPLKEYDISFAQSPRSSMITDDMMDETVSTKELVLMTLSADILSSGICPATHYLLN
jgi:hypothetical protein